MPCMCVLVSVCSRRRQDRDTGINEFDWFVCLLRLCLFTPHFENKLSQNEVIIQRGNKFIPQNAQQNIVQHRFMSNLFSLWKIFGCRKHLWTTSGF